MPDNDEIIEKMLKKVRAAIKKVTDGDLYDAKGNLTKEGYEALEELEGLNLYWVCDPVVKIDLTELHKAEANNNE